MAALAQQATTTSAVQELAAELLPRTRALAREMGAYLYEEIAELAASQDDELRAELLASTEANVGQVLRLLAQGAGSDEIVVPRKALEFLRSNVRRGIPLPALLRSYRLGHAWFWERWSQALQSRVAAAGELAAAQDESSAFMFDYIDKVSGALVDEFGTQRERMLRGAAQLRADTVRAILEDEPIDEEVASRQLGYALERQHIAMRVWSGAREVRGLERAVAEAAAALGPGKPLVVESGAARFDVWAGSFGTPDTAALAGYEPPPGVFVAFGKPANGVAGFRRSHVEALHAARISSLAGDGSRQVTGYARVELVSLLANDLPRARAFVADQLGPLGSPSEPMERLRATVLAFLEAGGSATRAAEGLYVHQNTVVYRVKKAEELLGHKVTERPVELICALTLADVLGTSALTGADGSG